MFPNQFNIALNLTAARFVLDNWKSFRAFTIVPSQSAQAIKYYLWDLMQEGGRSLETKVLGYNLGKEPLEIARREVTLNNYDTASMPDLTTILLALCCISADVSHVRLREEEGVLIFERAEDGIPMFDLVDEKSLKFSDLLVSSEMT